MFVEIKYFKLIIKKMMLKYSIIFIVIVWFIFTKIYIFRGTIKKYSKDKYKVFFGNEVRYFKYKYISLLYVIWKTLTKW